MKELMVFLYFSTSVPREGLVGLELPATKPVLKGPESPPEYYDSRLKRLNVPYWTRVPAPTEFVARALSRYVYTYHSFPSSFDVDLFIQDLVTKKHTYCSPLLMNAVLYTACVSSELRDRACRHMTADTVIARVLVSRSAGLVFSSSFPGRS